MKLLHTSDWHLGSTLCGKKRYDEFDLFFNWVLECIEKEQIDVVLISGDIFDTSNPSSKAIKYYFNFLGRVAKSRCRYVVVTAGNHDSPSLLDAPKELLKSLNIYAIGSMPEKIEDEVLVLKDPQNNPFLIVGAVPFLRDRDVRSVEAGESIDQKTQKLLKGIQEHYQNVCALAERKRSQLGGNIPVVVMGHLYAAGGHSIDGDGVRELYVGNLARVSTNAFPSGIDYLALGHLHSPQVINDCETIRYSGAPLPMGFAEAQQQKIVVSVEFIGEREIIIKEIAIPRFQDIMSIAGDFDSVTSKIRELKRINKPVWLEITLNENKIISDVQENINTIIRGSNIEVLKITNTRVINQILQQMRIDESLSDMNETDVFNRCLDVHEVPDEQRPELRASFNEILIEVHQSDTLMEGK
jgi:exonuclease SbcD